MGFYILWGKMNIFRFLGDMCHLFAMLLLLFKIIKTKSCIGVSARTQVLLAIVFLTRYSDLLLYYISMYNTGMKIAYITCTITTVCLIYGPFRKTYEQEYDRIRIEYLIAPCLIAALFINYKFTWDEIFWTFSIYLEAVAIIPQLSFTRQRGCTRYMTTYLLALGSYRALYILNWIFRYINENHVDYISSCGGIAQTLLFTTFLCLGCRKPEKENKLVEVSVIHSKQPNPLEMNINENDRQLLIEYIQRRETIRLDTKANVSTKNNGEECKVHMTRNP